MPFGIAPLDSEVKRRSLINQGYDPDKYDISDETFEVVPRPSGFQQPTQTTVSAAPQKYSIGGTVARNAALGVGPAAIGLAAGTKATIAAAPFTGPWAPAVGIPVGIGAGLLASIGQGKLIEQSDAGRQFLAETAEANVENPKSAVVGNLAANLPFMRPSISMLKDAAQAVRGGQGVLGSAGQVLASPAGQNIAMGAGLGAASGLYDEYVDPNPVNYGRLALNIAGGAALAKPTRLSQRYLGVPGYTSPDDYTGGIRLPSVEATPRNARFGVDEYGNVQDRNVRGVDIAEDTLSNLQKQKVKETVSQQNKRGEEYFDTMRKMEEVATSGKVDELAAELAAGKQIPPVDVYNPKTNPQRDYTRGIEQVSPEESAADLEMRRLEGHTGDKYQDAEQNHAVEVGRKIEEAKQQQKNLDYEEVKLEQEKAAIRKAKIDEVKKALELERKAIRSGGVYDGRVRQKQGVDTADSLQTSNLRERNLASAGKHRGIDFAYEQGRTISPADNPSARVFGYQSGNKIRATETKADTVPHEFSHKFMSELPAPQVKKFQKVLENDPVVRRWIANERAAGRNPGNDSVSAEFEYLAQRAGDTDVARIISKDNDLKKDLSSWWKTNFGKTASTDDLARWLTNRFRHAQTNRPGEITATPRGGVVQSRETQDTTEENPFQRMREEVIGKDTPQPSRESLAEGAERDRERNLDSRRYKSVRQEETQGDTQEGTRLYNELQPRLRAAMKSGGEEFQSLWKENERIKNTYFEGHTPEGYEKRRASGTKLQGEEQENTLDDFYYEASKMLRDEKALGTNPRAVVASEQLWNRLKNKITPLERELLQSAGIEDWLKSNPRVSGEKLSEWIQEHSPRVEVHSYGQEGKVSEAKAEYDRMTHEWYDGLDAKRQQAINYATADAISEEPQPYTKWPQHIRAELATMDKEKVAKYVELVKQVENEPRDTSPRATSYYNTVSPLDTKKHPVVRVDVVIPLKKTKWAEDWKELGYNSKEDYIKQLGDKDIKYSGQLWQPDNLHENLPNTLGWAMMQYVEHPTLGKVALVGEHQDYHIRKNHSDDTYSVRQEGYSKKYDSWGEANNALIKQYPILKDRQRLILKAAIQQAKKDGAKHIAISDGETAMMTEGHDAHGVPHLPTQGDYISKRNAEIAAKDLQNDNPTKQYRVKQSERGNWTVQEISRPTQEPGMRLNYDKILPQIMKDLTGVAGVKESFGEHKNALAENTHESVQREIRRLSEQRDAGEITGQQFLSRRHELLENPNLLQKSPRENLIFRNPDGTPKTDITAQVYPISDTPEKFSLTRNKYQDVDQSPTDTSTIDTSRSGFFRPLEAQFDKVRAHSIPVSEALKNWEAQKDVYIGKAQTTLKNLSSYPLDKVKQVESLMDDAYRGGKDTSFDEAALSSISDGAEIRRLLSDFYTEIGKKRRELGITIDGREAGLSENYIPHQLSDATIDLFVNRGNTPAARAAKREWAKHVEEQSSGSIPFDEAMENIQAYLNVLGGERNNYQSIQFNAIRKAAGYGLPESLRELNPLNNLEKYAKRAASDMSFYQHIESRPEILAALNLPDYKTGSIPKVEGVESVAAAREVRDAMKVVLNNIASISSTNPKFAAVTRLINSGLLGAGTGVRDVVSIPLNTLPYINRLSDFGAALKGISQFRQESANALNTAAKKPNLDKTTFGDILESPDRFTEMANRGATLLRKYQGREMLENFGRDVTFSIGKELAKNNLMAAKGGDAKGEAFLKKFGRLVEGDVKTKTGEELEAALNQIAKNLTDRVQGTYGGRGLPAGVMEGSLSPFLSLQKWGIEKSNVIYQDVYKPFITGENRLPMLTYLFGSVLTGAAIQEMNKALTGRRPNEADIQESLAEGSAKNIAAELATLMQLGSYAGILSDGVKFASDIALKGKTPRNLVSFPTATSAVDLQEKLADYSEALQQGSDPWTATKMFALDMMTHNIQNARMLANRTGNKDEAERSDKFRDLRVYRELTGAPVGEPTKSNKYLDTDVRDYKQEKSLEKAAQTLPALLSRFQSKVQDNPEKALKWLQSLKANNYQTIPNPANSPMEFAEYYNFLRKTQGDKVASDRVENYIQQSASNRVKSAMVP